MTNLYRDALDRPMTIGELRKYLVTKPRDHEVRFDFCRTAPVDCGSSRGDYSEPSLFPGSDAKATVASVLGLLEQLTTEEHHGYKGGRYRYDESSPLWVDEHGDWTSTAVIGVTTEHPWFVDVVVLLTGPVDR